MAAVNDTTAADTMVSPSEINWDDIKIPNNCEKCHKEYDCIDDAHESLCVVCQELYGAGDYSSTATGFDESTNTTAASVERPLKEGEIRCSICWRRFKPNANGNGVDCTWCCNTAARKGIDLFAKQGRDMTTKAKQLLEDYHEKQRIDAQASKSVAGSSPASIVCSDEETPRREPTSMPASSHKRRRTVETPEDGEYPVKGKHDTKRPKSKYESPAGEEHDIKHPKIEHESPTAKKYDIKRVKTEYKSPAGVDHDTIHPKAEYKDAM